MSRDRQIEERTVLNIKKAGLNDLEILGLSKGQKTFQLRDLLSGTSALGRDEGAAIQPLANT